MDRRLLGWARAVKARGRSGQPVLWLFTDLKRVPDPLPVIARLPKGLCGVVFRHEGAVDRTALAASVARLCRARGMPLTIAGDRGLAVRHKAGVHLRGGKGRPLRGVLNTSSAHDAVDMRRASRAGVLVFLSPAFATLSHPGSPSLGPWRWGSLARGLSIGALGGIDGATVRRLPRGRCVAVGAIGALGDD